MASTWTSSSHALEFRMLEDVGAARCHFCRAYAQVPRQLHAASAGASHSRHRPRTRVRCSTAFRGRKITHSTMRVHLHLWALDKTV